MKLYIRFVIVTLALALLPLSFSEIHAQKKTVTKKSYQKKNKGMKTKVVTADDIPIFQEPKLKSNQFELYNLVFTLTKPGAIDVSVSSPRKLVGEVTIPPKVTYKGKTYIVTKIEKNAFPKSEISKLRIPPTVNYLPFSALSYVEAVELQSIKQMCMMQHPAGNIGGWHCKVYINGELLTDLVIPDNIESINDLAFSNIKHLRSVVIPSSVIYIGSYTFADLDNLEKIILEDGNKTLEIKNRNFASMKLREIYLGRNLKFDYSGMGEGWHQYLGVCPFAKKQDVDTLTISESVTSIPEGCFFNSRFKKINLGDNSNISEIGNGAFWATRWNGNLKFSPELSFVDESAFLNAVGDSITMPNVMFLEANAFADCSIFSLNLGSGDLEIADRAFANARIGILSLPDKITGASGIPFYDASIKKITFNPSKGTGEILPDFILNAYKSQGAFRNNKNSR